ncbi:nucleolar complex protein 4 homolog [Oscarella lobularis]|uniref:nucleolar complex protein 4 homolog n=1 Tax=Oscarella lobularis TaxID=121494 RepID=UPI003313350E
MDLAAVKAKCVDFLASPENANALVDILEFSENEDNSVVRASIKSLKKACKHLIDTEREAVVGKVVDRESAYETWIREKYRVCLRRFFELTNHENSSLRKLSFESLLKVCIEEGRALSQEIYTFPVETFQFIVRSATHYDATGDLIQILEENLRYDDVRYHTLRELKNVIEIEMEKGSGGSVSFVTNCFRLLQSVEMPSSGSDLTAFLIGSPPGEGECAVGTRKKRRAVARKLAKPVQDKVTVLLEHRRSFGDAWLAFLRFPLPSSVYKRVLVSLHKTVMPHLVDPKVLIDFLTDSYNIGGSVSLLALNGLFVLIQEHNLDYPDFFVKLYALLDQSIFHAKYVTRFFRLLDVFLTSSHLPAYLVAAFIKRLARLSLTAPPSGIILVIPFICNLIKRHPACRVLVHRKTDEGLDCDPYLMNEADPAKSNALKSSLWEIMTMKCHYLPAVSSLVALLEQPLDKPEHDMEKHVDQTYDHLFSKAIGKKSTQFVPRLHSTPKAEILDLQIH